MAQNVKTLNMDKIEHFLLKNMQFTQNFENIYQYCDLSMCLLVDLVQGKKREFFFIINIHFNIIRYIFKNKKKLSKFT